MRYFKIIQNDAIIGAGTNFIRWFPRSGRFAICELEQAQAVIDAVTEQKYHADWLQNVPASSGASFPEAEIVLIQQAEYDDIVEELMDGETIPVPEPEPEPTPTPEPEPEPEPETRMTVQEMREKIAELTSMTAKENYSKGAYFVFHDIVYLATRPIVKGTEVKPGINCIKKSYTDLKGE